MLWWAHIFLPFSLVFPFSAHLPDTLLIEAGKYNLKHERIGNYKRKGKFRGWRISSFVPSKALLVFYFCVTDCYRLSGLNQYTFIIMKFQWVRGLDMAWLDPLFRVSKDHNRNVLWWEGYSELSLGSSSSLTQETDKNQFLVAVGLRLTASALRGCPLHRHMEAICLLPSGYSFAFFKGLTWFQPVSSPFWLIYSQLINNLITGVISSYFQVSPTIRRRFIPGHESSGVVGHLRVLPTTRAIPALFITPYFLKLNLACYMQTIKNH